MRFSIVSRHLLALLSLGALSLAACSSPNPLGALDQQLPDAGSSATTNATGDDDSPPTGQGSTPSPPISKGPGSNAPDAGAITSDGGTSPPSNADSGSSSSASDAGTSTGDAGGGGASSALLQRCVSDLNSYRAQAGVAALAESSALEAYGALAAASDAQSGTTHGYFATNHGNGVSSAESELPAWPANQYASTSDLVDQGVAAIFNQGPGSAPYDNLVNATFTHAGCGVATTADGNVWVTFEYQ